MILSVDVLLILLALFDVSLAITPKKNCTRFVLHTSIRGTLLLYVLSSCVAIQPSFAEVKCTRTLFWLFTLSGALTNF